MEENHAKFVQEREAGAVVFRYQNKTLEFLIIHRTKQDDWSLPKGHVEKGETLEECALRELTEETGWSGKISMFVGKIDYQYPEKDTGFIRKVSVHYFLVEPTTEDPSLINKEEIKETKWLSNKYDWATELTYDTDIEIIKKALRLINDNHK